VVSERSESNQSNQSNQSKGEGAAEASERSARESALHTRGRKIVGVLAAFDDCRYKDKIMQAAWEASGKDKP